jgi:hypothetical protein
LTSQRLDQSFLIDIYKYESIQFDLTVTEHLKSRLISYQFFFILNVNKTMLICNQSQWNEERQ